MIGISGNICTTVTTIFKSPIHKESICRWTGPKAAKRSSRGPLLQLWVRRSLVQNLPFKLLQASIKGGREQAPPTITHQAQHKDKDCSESPHISTILHINGLIGHSPVTFLPDSGGAMSVVRLDAVASEFRDMISKDTSAAPVGANGSPLDVVGQVKIPELLRLSRYLWLLAS